MLRCTDIEFVWHLDVVRCIAIDHALSLPIFLLHALTLPVCSDVRRLWLMRTCNHCVHCRFGLCCVFGGRGNPAALQPAALQPAPIQPPDAEGVGCIIGRRPLNSLLCLGTVNRFWHTRQAVAVPGWQSAIGLPGRILVGLLPGEHRHRPSGRRADFGVF